MNQVGAVRNKDGKQEHFSMRQLRFMDFVEQSFLMHGSIPSKEACLGAVAGLEASDYVAYTNNPRIIRHMRDDRGIELQPINTGGALSAEQLVCANTLLDLSDKRSERNKLKDLKISTTKYEAWKRDPAFSAYMRQRAENALDEHMPDIHMALIDIAKRGDMSAIKHYYEMTGRWSSKTVGDLNIEFLLMKIIETIQRHVTQPEVMQAIAEDLAMLAPGTGVAAGGNRAITRQIASSDPTPGVGQNPLLQPAQVTNPVGAFEL